MTLFAVITSTPPPDFASRVQAAFPNNSYALKGANSSEWIIAAEAMTSKQVGDKLGISEGAAGRMIIVPFTTYYGYHSTDLWEWIKLRLGTPNG